MLGTEAIPVGMWDSHGARGGLGEKFQRVLVSEIIGVDAEVGKRPASRIDPLIRTTKDMPIEKWPPHPDRLFSALVQAWGDLGEPEDGKAALQWLERLPSPSLRFRDLPEEFRRTNVIRYVPANDDMKVMGRLRNPRRLPSAWVGDDPVDLYWPDSDPGEHRMALDRLTSAIASLGHPSSLVTIRLIREGTGEAALASIDGKWLELVPDPGGPIALRVPYPERLDHLIEQFRAQPRQRPASGAWATYSLARPGVQATSGVFGDILIFRLKGTGRLPLVSTSQSDPLVEARPRVCQGVRRQVRQGLAHRSRGMPPRRRAARRHEVQRQVLDVLENRLLRGHFGQLDRLDSNRRRFRPPSQCRASAPGSL